MKYIKLFESNKQLSLKEKLIFILKVNDELWENDSELILSESINNFLQNEIDMDSDITHNQIDDDIIKKIQFNLEIKSHILSFYDDLKNDLSKIPTKDDIEECFQNLFDDYEYFLEFKFDDEFGLDRVILFNDIGFMSNSIINDLDSYLSFNKNLEFSNRLIKEKGFEIKVKLTHNSIIICFTNNIYNY